MKTNTRDNVAKFIYDCAKVAFTVLVIGPIIRRPLVLTDLGWGAAFTLTLVASGVIIDQRKARKEE